ncbi:MAG: hypothetical protein ACXAC5_11870 [Promethearchaeota archaeon]
MWRKLLARVALLESIKRAVRARKRRCLEKRRSRPTVVAYKLLWVRIPLSLP